MLDGLQQHGVLLHRGAQIFILASILGVIVCGAPAWNYDASAMAAAEFRAWFAGINIACFRLFVLQAFAAMVLALVIDWRRAELASNWVRYAASFVVGCWHVYVLLGLAGGAISTPQSEFQRAMILWETRSDSLLLVFSGLGSW